jgi:hypothetical protein
VGITNERGLLGKDVPLRKTNERGLLGKDVPLRNSPQERTILPDVTGMEMQDGGV